MYRDPQKTARRILRHLWIYLLYWSGLLAWARRRVTASAGIIVLTLHRVLDEEDFQNTNSPRGMVMRSSTYEALLQCLKERCETVSFTGAPPSWTSRPARPRFAVTFDDGWKDTFAVAYPLAERFGVPITVFVCPGLAGRQDPFWPEQVLRAWRIATGSAESQRRFTEICAEADVGDERGTGPGDIRVAEMLIERLKELRQQDRDRIVQKLCGLVRESGLSASAAANPMEATMTWDDTAQIAHRGVQIGSHTFDHQILTTVPIPEAERELADSKRAIESALGRTCDMFAYPSGLWSQEIRNLVIQAGHLQAFVNQPGVWWSDTDPWLIPRVNVWEGTFVGPSGEFSPIVFQYATFWRCYRAEVLKRRNNKAEAPVL